MLQDSFKMLKSRYELLTSMLLPSGLEPLEPTWVLKCIRRRKELCVRGFARSSAISLIQLGGLHASSHKASLVTPLNPQHSAAQYLVGGISIAHSSIEWSSSHPAIQTSRHPAIHASKITKNHYSLSPVLNPSSCQLQPLKAL